MDTKRKGKNTATTCAICLEKTEVERIFSVNGCQHRYCFTCMKQHVEMKLLHGMVPKCPHPGCNSELSVETSTKFLTSKLIERMTQTIKEASIPVTDKLYCPFPHCSALMSIKEIVGSEHTAARRCLKCYGFFCINCKVPCHFNITCGAYNPPGEDVKLKSLASRNLWRQCVKCSHMIELSQGCYHITCRCGFEFCYKCGAEWRCKVATCSCPRRYI